MSKRDIENGGDVDIMEMYKVLQREVERERKKEREIEKERQKKERENEKKFG